jgi:hypothetical protein
MKHLSATVAFSVEAIKELLTTRPEPTLQAFSQWAASTVPSDNELTLNLCPMTSIYIYQREEEQMTNYSEITTDRFAETVAPHDHPKTTIENVSEVVASQADENRRLTVENRILWDLLLFDLPEVEMYETDDNSTLVAGVEGPH